MTVPFICLFISFLIVFLVRIPGIAAMAKLPGGYNNRNPRAQQAQLADLGARATAAHYNSIEAFCFFAAAVFVAHLGNAAAQWSNILAVSFVVARVVYCILYLADLAALRSIVWGVGFFATIGLFLSPSLFPG